MAKVTEPRIKPDGMVYCKDCPLDDYECYNMALFFSDDNVCPTLETYQEAIELAEQEAAK